MVGAVWFWRTAHGDDVDLLVETGPETFVAIECKAAERVESRATRGIVKLAAEYGPQALRAARVVWRGGRQAGGGEEGEGSQRP